MDNNLKKLIDEYIDEFLNQDIVKQYFALEESINNSLYLQTLQDKMKKAQKDLALSINDDTYSEKKRLFLSLQDEFYNNPMVVNYRLLQEEIYSQISLFKSKLIY